MAEGIARTDLRHGASHQGFLRHRNFLWLKVALAVSLLALLGYALIDVQPRPNGGSWYGYTLGTIAVLLILWLTLLGIRKRAMTRGRWSLKAWTSAHVYLGLSLVVIATLHTGFQFGWNVHTLAYALMMLVILSGLYGIVVYATLPSELGASRVGDDPAADDRRGDQARPPAPDRRPAARSRGCEDRQPRRSTTMRSAAASTGACPAAIRAAGRRARWREVRRRLAQADRRAGATRSRASSACSSARARRWRGSASICGSRRCSKCGSTSMCPSPSP